MTSRLIGSFVLTALVCVGSLQAFSADVDYEVRVGAGRSDNVGRTETADIEENIAVVGLKFDLRHQSRRVDLNVNADMEFRDYLKDTFDNEIVGGLSADLIFQIAPDIFDWVFENRFGNLQTNPFEANTPVNRQDINIFSTGPDFHVRLGPRTRLELGSRYSSSHFEISDINNAVVDGQLTLLRAISPNRVLSAALVADRIEFENTNINSNYDRQAAYFGFDSENSRSTLAVRVGFNELHDNGEVADGNLYDITWNRDLGASTSLTLRYNQSLTDANDMFGRFQEPGRRFSEVQQSAGVSDPFENKRASVAFEFGRRESLYYMSAAYNDDDYVTVNSFDRNRTEFRVGISRAFGPAWQVNLDGGIQRIDFKETDREDDDWLVRLGLSRQVIQNLRVNIDISRADRSSNVIGASYVENLFFLTFRYSR